MGTQLNAASPPAQVVGRPAATIPFSYGTFLSDTATGDAGPSARLARVGAGPVLALVLAGLLAQVVNHEEASAGIGYGLSLLALLGAAGCIVSLTGRLASGPDPLPWAVSARLPRPAAALAVVRVRGEDWPVLVALLFGAIVALISGLGGWV